MTEQTQLAFLKSAQAELGVTWDDLAAQTDIAPRALKTYRLQPASKGYRGMSKLTQNAIVAALEKGQENVKKRLRRYALSTMLVSKGGASTESAKRVRIAHWRKL
jgi:hypothetical protein